jgi:hypothetical protein
VPRTPERPRDGPYRSSPLAQSSRGYDDDDAGQSARGAAAPQPETRRGGPESASQPRTSTSSSSSSSSSVSSSSVSSSQPSGGAPRSDRALLHLAADTIRGYDRELQAFTDPPTNHALPPFEREPWVAAAHEAITNTVRDALSFHESLLSKLTRRIRRQFDELHATVAENKMLRQRIESQQEAADRYGSYFFFFFFYLNFFFDF